MKELTICGKAYPAAFGIRTMREAAKAMNGEFGDIVGGEIQIEVGLDMITAVARVALNEGARKSGIPDRYTEDQVVDFFDDEPTLLKQVQELFSESTTVNPDALGELGECSPREETKKRPRA